MTHELDRRIAALSDEEKDFFLDVFTRRREDLLKFELDDGDFFVMWDGDGWEHVLCEMGFTSKESYVCEERPTHIENDSIRPIENTETMRVMKILTKLGGGV